MRLLTILSLSILLSGLSAHLLTDDDCKSVLSAHNNQRSSWGCPHLEWDDTLANSASTWAENCECKTSSEDKCGQNVAFTTMTNDQFPSCEWQVTNQWCESEKDWDCETNTCSGGASVCNSFTQIIWKNSSKVGCGVSTCPSGTIDASNDVQFLVCFYNVQGNQPNIHPLTCSEEKPETCTSSPPKPAHAAPPPHVTPPPPKPSAPKPSPPPKEAPKPSTPKPSPPPKEAPKPSTPKPSPPPKEASPPPHASSPPPKESGYNAPPKQASPPPHVSSPPPKEASPPPHVSSPPPKEASPPPKEASPPPKEASPPPKEASPPPEQSSGSHYAALADTEASLASSSNLSLGVWIGICVGSSALTALVVGLIAFFVAKRGNNAERA